MNDFSELENELKKLRPAQPSAELIMRIEADLVDPVTSTASAGVLPKPERLRVNWFGLGLGFAAAAAFLLLARVDFDPVASKPPVMASNTPSVTSTVFKDEFVPGDATRVVFDTRDEGLRYLDGAEQPVRRTSSRSRETMQWENPKTGASLRVSYPREEVTLTPVSGQ